MSYTVGHVAGLAGVTVRTLHHYDEIGLLTPAHRSGAGYRRYTDGDLERLQDIRYYRELGFGLDEIAALLADPHADHRAHLKRQHDLLTSRIGRLSDMVAAVERAMEAETMGISMTPEERFEVFGDNDPAQYAEEAEQRWGETDAYRESHRRTKSYTKDDWMAIKAESAALTDAAAAALAAGEPASSNAAMDAVERHRQHISRWFYECDYGMHRGLAEMYVADERFAANYERVAPGLAQYMHDAILANAERHQR